MSGINYDLKKIRAIAFDVDGVLSPSVIPMSETGEPMRMVNIKDGYALQLAVKSGIIIAIISGGKSEAVRHRFNALGITDIYLGASDKLPVFRKWLESVGLQADEIAYVGDDIPDLPVLKACGLPVAPRDAAAEVKDVARFITGADGGYGAGRELVEQVLRAKGLWMSHADAFGW